MSYSEHLGSRRITGYRKVDFYRRIFNVAHLGETGGEGGCDMILFVERLARKVYGKSVSKEGRTGCLAYGDILTEDEIENYKNEVMENLRKVDN